MKRRSVTLIEIMVVLVIIGVLAAFTIPNFGRRKEDTLDNEALAVLKQMSEAEKFYYLERDSYYLSSGATAKDHIENINHNLKLDLFEGDGRSWNYYSYVNGCVQSTRNGGDGRNWCLRIDDLDGEPNSGNPCGTCPQ